MDNAEFDSMSNELQSDNALDTQLENVGSKPFNNNDGKLGNTEKSGLWPDKKVYYTFSPGVGKQRFIFLPLKRLLFFKKF